MSRRSDALTAIENERTYQDGKYGETPSLANDILLVAHYAEKVRLSFVNGDDLKALDRLRKVAALALRAMETWGTIERDGNAIAVDGPAVDAKVVTEEELLKALDGVVQTDAPNDGEFAGGGEKYGTPHSRA